ncbi:MAG: glycosyltransferase family 2 protein [Anaerolineaceae bacterium]|nr:glycosyltransferase family 2 protein [Anaerolineaceae bacterium]MCY4008477.1 glycosyltransferase family 2 protein [Anaerolineaceae bacterium]
MSPRTVVSVITPVYNETGLIDLFYERLARSLDGAGVGDWELIFVDDGSEDSSPEELQAIVCKDERVKCVHLSRNFGQEQAVAAGIDQAVGQAVVLIDVDLQDPPEIIPKMIAKWREGYQVVYGTRSSRRGENWFKLLSAKFFYRLIDRITDIEMPLDSGMFRLLDRQVIQALQQMPERHRFLRGMTSWVGFRQTGVLYDRDERRIGSTKYPFRKMFLLSLDAITSFSYFPLQLMLYASLFLILVSMGLVPVILILRLGRGPDFFGGQATSILLILLLSAFQLFFLFIIGQYVGRIFDEVRQRPLYLIREHDHAETGKTLPASPEDETEDRR